MEYNNEELNGGYNNSRPIYVERKRNGCWGDALKIGCGFIAGVLATIFFSAFFYSSFAVRDDDTVLESYKAPITEDTPKRVRYFQVRSKKGKATIHTGMPKDSVILLLGQPSEFMSTDYIDYIAYRYGNFDSNYLRIEFKEGKVNSVSQH